MQRVHVLAAGLALCLNGASIQAQTIQFATASATVPEEAGIVAITVTISAPATARASLSFGGTATVGSDYTATPFPEVTFSAGGPTTATAYVHIRDDAVIEPNETFVVTLGGPVGAALGAITSHTVTITGNEPTVRVATANANVGEGSGTTVVAVAKSHPRHDVVVRLGLSGSAAAGTDYRATAGPVRLANPAIGGDFNEMGSSMAMIGNDIVAVGSPLWAVDGTNNVGAVFLYDRSGTFLQAITNPAPTRTSRFGWSLAPAGDRLLVGAYTDNAAAVAAGAAYLVTLNGTVLAAITNPAPAAGDNFGWDVAMAGTNLLISAHQDDAGATDAGAAYLYSPAGVLVTAITNSTPAANDRFGYSVAAIGTNFAISAPFDSTNRGAVYVYNPAGVLIRTIVNPVASNDQFGISIDGLGTNLLVGANANDTGGANAGIAYLMSPTGAVVAVFTNPAPSAADAFGESVAAAGANVLVGAPFKDIPVANTGMAFLFAPSGALLLSVTNPAGILNDNFGQVVASGGTNVLVAARKAEGTGTDSGVVYLFAPGGARLATFTNAATATQDNFGYSVAALGTNLLVGAYSHDLPFQANSGRAYLLSRAGEVLAVFTNPAPAADDEFGVSVAAAGTNVLIGAGAKDIGAVNTGAAYLFSPAGTLLVTITNPAPAVDDLFGFTAAGLGTNLLIGAPFDDSTSNSAGTVYLYAPNGALVRTFTNPAPQDGANFGASIAPAGTNLLVGAPYHQIAGTEVGIAYLIAQSGAVITTFTNPAPDEFDAFGYAVAAAGTNVLIGCRSGGPTNEGIVYLFASSGALLVTITNPAPAEGDAFGHAVGSAGEYLLIGASGDNAGQGAVHLYARTGGLLETFTHPRPQANDRFGFSLAGSGSDGFVVGAHLDEDPGSTSGSAWYFSVASSGGALDVPLPAGATSAVVRLTILDDAVAEPNEPVTFTIASVVGGAATGTPVAVTITILDNDGSPDSDGDGLPDAWETANGLNPAVSNAPSANADGDWMTDREEYWADTQPTNPASFFAPIVASNAAPGIMTLHISSTSPQRTYRVHANTNLLESPQTWPTIGGAVTGTGGAITFTITNTPTLRHYRTGVGLP